MAHNNTLPEYNEEAIQQAFDELDWTGYPDNFPRVPANKHSFAKRGLVYGVGVNDMPYMVQPRGTGRGARDPAYAAWTGILQRCYSASCQRRQPWYIGVTVCKEWHVFSNFRRWLLAQPHWRDRAVDKDLLSPGNRVYSPATCLMVPQAVNVLFLGAAKRTAANADLAVGVSRSGKRYLAQLGVFSKNTYGPLRATPEEAAADYRAMKMDYAFKVAQQYITDPEPRIHDVILDNVARVFAPQHYN